MSPELIAVLTIGVTLAGGQLGTVLWLTARMDRSAQQLRAEMQGSLQQSRAEMQGSLQQFRAEMHADLQQIRGDIRALETRVSSIEQGQARLEGLVDGLREVLTGRAAPTT